MTGRGAAGLVALVSIGLVGVGTAIGAGSTGADTNAQATWIPDDWRELPALVGGAGSEPGARVSSKAWGDPAAGVFGLVTVAMVAAGASDIEAIHESFRSDSQKRGATVSDWVVAGRESRHRFELGAFRGAVFAITTVSAGDKLTTAAASCFYTDRQPRRSEQTCEEFLRRFEENQR